MEKFKTSVTSQFIRRCSARISLSQSYSQYITHPSPVSPSPSMDLMMRAVLLVLMLSQVPARPRMEDMEEDMENNLLELDLPPAQEDDDQLDKEQMLWMRKRGGLLQPDWILRTINQDPKMTWNQEKRQRTELENLLKFITEYYLRKQEATAAVFMRG